MAKNLNLSTTWDDLGLSFRLEDYQTLIDYYSQLGISSFGDIWKYLKTIKNDKTGNDYPINYIWLIDSVKDYIFTYNQAGGTYQVFYTSSTEDTYLLTKNIDYPIVRITKSQFAMRPEATPYTDIWYIDVVKTDSEIVKDIKLRDHNLYSEYRGIITDTPDTNRTGYVTSISIGDPNQNQLYGQTGECTTIDELKALQGIIETQAINKADPDWTGMEAYGKGTWYTLDAKDKLPNTFLGGIKWLILNVRAENIGADYKKSSSTRFKNPEMVNNYNYTNVTGVSFPGSENGGEVRYQSVMVPLSKDLTFSFYQSFSVYETIPSELDFTIVGWM